MQQELTLGTVYQVDTKCLKNLMMPIFCGIKTTSVAVRSTGHCYFSSANEGSIITLQV